MEQERLQCLQVTLYGTGETAVSTNNSQWNMRDCSVYTSLTLEQERLQYLQVTLKGTGETAVSTRRLHWNRRECSAYR